MTSFSSWENCWQYFNPENLDCEQIVINCLNLDTNADRLKLKKRIHVATGETPRDNRSSDKPWAAWGSVGVAGQARREMISDRAFWHVDVADKTLGTRNQCISCKLIARARFVGIQNRTREETLTIFVSMLKTPRTKTFISSFSSFFLHCV